MGASFALDPSHLTKWDDGSEVSVTERVQIQDRIHALLDYISHSLELPAKGLYFLSSDSLLQHQLRSLPRASSIPIAKGRKCPVGDRLVWLWLHEVVVNQL